jgi:hypothetical protein
MITENELDVKYPVDTPHWRKDAVERYLCEKHNEPTAYIRDIDMVIHTLSETECN